MRVADIDTSKNVLIIAEIGNNHEGSIDVALELVRRAAEAGADAVKFQTFRTEHYVSRVQAERFARLKKFELDQSQFRRLADEARRHGLAFISTPFDIASAQFLGGIVDAIKIASGDNTFYPLIETAAETGRPLILSTGLATLAEIRFAVGLIERVWQRLGVSPGLALLHCVSAYPVPPNEANLAAIGTLAKQFDATIGYSDHTLGNEAAILSVGVGARVIEKHFTLDRNFSDFRDHQLSADPAMLADLVRAVRRAVTLLGDGIKQPSKSELEGLRSTRRSIAVAADLPAGTTLAANDITWVRPGDGFAPGTERLVLGRALKRSLQAGTVIMSGDLE